MRSMIIIVVVLQIVKPTGTELSTRYYSKANNKSLESVSEAAGHNYLSHKRNRTITEFNHVLHVASLVTWA